MDKSLLNMILRIANTKNSPTPTPTESIKASGLITSDT